MDLHKSEVSPHQVAKDLLAFRRATRVSEHNPKEDGQANIEPISASQFTKIMHYSLTQLVTNLYSLFNINPDQIKSSADIPRRKKQWKQHSRFVRSFVESSFEFLQSLEGVGSELSSFCVTQLYNSVPFVASLSEGIKKKCIKIMLEMLCCQDDQTQLSASQFLRHLGALDQHSLEILLKAGFASVTSHFSTPYPDRFLQDCLINFFGINADESYNALFMLLRDMSNCLRGSISNTKESNESISVLFSWRHINRMRLIERIISTHIQSQQSSQSQQQSSQDNNNNKQSFNNLRQLIYPLIEISLGAAQVASGSRLWPLRLHYTQIAIDSAQTIRSWTHSLYLLIEILQGSELRQPPKLKQNKKNINGRNSSKVVSKSNNNQKVQQFTKTSDIRSKNRVSKEIVGERSYQDSVVRLVIDQIYQITSTHASSLSFPELILPIFHFIRPLIKKMDSYENQKQLKALIAILTKNCEWICDIREKQNLSLGEQKIVEDVEYKLIQSSSNFGQDSVQQQQTSSQSIQIPITTKSNESIPPLTRFWKQKQIELKQNQIRLINAQKQAEDLINQKRNNDENQDQNNMKSNFKQEEDEEVSNEEEDSIKQNKPLNNRKRFRREDQESEEQQQEQEQSQGKVELLQLPPRNIIKKQLKRSLIEDKQREEKKIKLRNEKKKKKEFDLEKEQENIINKKNDNLKKNKKKFNQKQSNKNFRKNRFGNKQNIRRRFKARK